MKKTFIEKKIRKGKNISQRKLKITIEIIRTKEERDPEEEERNSQRLDQWPVSLYRTWHRPSTSV